MVQHGIRIGFLHSRQALVALEQRTVKLLGQRVLNRDAMALPELLRPLQPIAQQGPYLGEFRFIEHRHFAFTSPTPEQLHSPPAHPSP
ncbi:MAG: hypothetical protein WBX18_01830, partial [Terracidiphilus sp.]